MVKKKKKSINISPTTEISYMNYCKWLCPSATELGRVKRILPCGPRFLVGTQRTIWGLTCGKNKFIDERTERTPQGRAGLSQERHWRQNDEEWGFLKTRLLHIHLGGQDWQFWLTAASYITTGSIAHVFPIIQSIIIRCMYV